MMLNNFRYHEVRAYDTGRCAPNLDTQTQKLLHTAIVGRITSRPAHTKTCRKVLVLHTICGRTCLTAREAVL